MLKRIGMMLFLLIGFTTSYAAGGDAEIKERLATIMPGINIEGITTLDNTGMYEAVVNGEIIYFSEDLRYVFQGDVVSLETRQNITELKRVSLRKVALADLKEADLIVFEPKKTEHTLTVFTDIDCGYCRKLHQKMSDYNDLGIRIRYMAYPRAGIDSKSFDKAENVWCAEDRQQAMTGAKAGKDVSAESCDSPVKAHFELGQRIGVRGTPALFLENGQMLPGYVPPQRLKKILDEQALVQF